MTELSHRETVLSFLRPDQPFDGDVIQSFCHYVNQFHSPATAATWIAEHPGTFAISFDDALRLADTYVLRIFQRPAGDG